MRLDSTPGLSRLTRCRAVLVFSALLAACASSASAAVSPSHDAIAAQLGLTRFSTQRFASAAPATTVTFPIELDGQRVTLDLNRSALRSPEFEVLVQVADGRLVHAEPPAAATYRGAIRELAGSRAGGTWRAGELRVTIALADGRTYFVQPLRDAFPDADPAAHVVYLDADAVVSGTCGTTEHSVAVPGADPKGGPSAEATEARVADLAVDCDFEMYTLNGSSVDATVSDIENVLSGVNVVYDRDCGIQHRLVKIIVRSAEPDPYSSLDPDTLLDQLEAHWNTSETAIARDMVHLMTGKNVAGSVIGISGVGVVCNRSRAYGLSQSRFSTNLSRRVALSAHEMGHNWNAEHCDGISPCNIMCSSLGGCDGIGLPNFEPTGANAIKAFAATRTCLDSPATGVPPTVSATDVQLAAAAPTPSNGATRLSYFLADAGRVQLEIFDVAGHRVALVANQAETPGWHTRTWDGVGRTGQRARPGVYQARLAANGAIRTTRLILVE